LRTRRWLALLPIAIVALAPLPAWAAESTAAPWGQYQGNAERSGSAPAGTPEPPYTVSWNAAAGIGDPSHVAGDPAPVLTDRLAIVVGRETVDAIDVTTRQQAWTVPRALGPSSPPAVQGHLLLFLEGGGDESATGGSSSTTSATPAVTSSATPTKGPSRSGSPGGSPSPPPVASSGVSTLVAVDLRSRDRLWTVPLSDVSHTGVLLHDDVAYVGADDGTVVAVDLHGDRLWSQDVGDHVLAAIAASADLLFVSVRPESRGTATLVALHPSDGTQAWRYEPTGAVLDLGAPSVGTDATGGTVFLVASDATLRAVDAEDGSERWAAQLYAPTGGAPPALTSDTAYVTDSSGTVYAFDRATGAERWRFATNHAAVAAPIVSAGAVLQPGNDGTLSAIAPSSGHETWQGDIADSALLGIAAATGLLVVSHTGTAPGIAALTTDPAGVTEDLVSPTTPDPAGLVWRWAAASVPLTVVFLLLGRLLAARMGMASLGEDVDDVEDPWERDLEDEP
jgi:outer membrane protein assembly factor BamB